MLTDSESRVVGPLVVAFGTAFFAAGLARILWPAADGMIYLASLGIGFGFPLFAAGLWSIRADMRRLDADLADRTAARLARLQPAQPATEPVAEADEAEPDDRGWYLAVEITLLAGQVSGFTDTGLTPIMGSDARPKMQKFLTDRGVLALRPSGYGWADDVTLADALRRLRAGDLAPFPAEPAPEVRAPMQPATRREAPRRAAKVVDGVAKAVD